MGGGSWQGKNLHRNDKHTSMCPCGAATTSHFGCAFRCTGSPVVWMAQNGKMAADCWSLVEATSKLTEEKTQRTKPRSQQITGFCLNRGLLENSTTNFFAFSWDSKKIEIVKQTHDHIFRAIGWTNLCHQIQKIHLRVVGTHALHVISCQWIEEDNWNQW